MDEHGSVAVGGNSEQISTFLDQRHQDGMSLAEALRLAVQALSTRHNGAEREIPAERLEVAVLDRTRPQQRKFKRIVGRQLSRLLEADVRQDRADATAPSDLEETEDEYAPRPSAPAARALGPAAAAPAVPGSASGGPGRGR